MCMRFTFTRFISLPGLSQVFPLFSLLLHKAVFPYRTITSTHRRSLLDRLAERINAHYRTLARIIIFPLSGLCSVSIVRIETNLNQSVQRFQGVSLDRL